MSAREVAERIAAYLRNLPDEVERVSTRRLKQECELQGCPASTFKRGRDRAMKATSDVEDPRGRRVKAFRSNSVLGSVRVQLGFQPQFQPKEKS